MTRKIRIRSVRLDRLAKTASSCDSVDLILTHVYAYHLAATFILVMPVHLLLPLFLYAFPDYYMYPVKNSPIAIPDQQILK